MRIRRGSADGRRVRFLCRRSAAREFQEAAKKVGARVEVEVLPDRNHYSAMRRLPEPDDPTFARILEFFASTRTK